MRRLIFVRGHAVTADLFMSRLAMTTSTRHVLLEAIFSDPEDDAARLVYGDLLQQIGDPRGEFIVVQVALNNEPDKKQRKVFEKRAKELLSLHGKSWRDEIGVTRGLGPFRRGFVESLEVSGKKFLEICKQVFGATPITDLKLVEFNTGYFPMFMNHPCLSTVRALDLSENNAFHSEHFARGIARSESLSNLQTLRFSNCKITDEGAQSLVSDGARYKGLRVLDLTNCGLSDVAAHAIAACNSLPALHTVYLADNSISPAGQEALKARFGQHFFG